jgi:hypothetical protein
LIIFKRRDIGRRRADESVRAFETGLFLLSFLWTIVNLVGTLI